MRGTVIRGRKLWHPVIDDPEPDPQTGKRKQRWHQGHPTKKAAERALANILAERQSDTYVTPSRVTLGRFLSDEWLPAVRGRLRPGTFALYSTIVASYIAPRLGSRELQELRPAHLNAFYGELLESGRRGGRALSPKSVRNVHTTIRRALQDAVRWGRLSRNPAALVSAPRSAPAEMRTWNAAELGAFLEHVRGDRLHAAWILAATTGMRRGELLALRWADVDLEEGRLSVRRALVLAGGRPQVSDAKTAKGRRSVPFPSAAATALRAHRRAQVEERLALGPGYQDDDLVFCREDGAALHPDTFSEAFERHARAAGLPRIRLHDLRHTWATLALQSGEHPKVVSEILGHASIGITLDVYSHAVPALGEQAAERVAALIFPAR